MLFVYIVWLLAFSFSISGKVCLLTKDVFYMWLIFSYLKVFILLKTKGKLTNEN